MTAARVLVIAVGVALGLVGLRLLLDAGDLLSVAIWVAGGILVHDLVIAPLVVGIGALATRLVPAHAQAVAVAAFILWGTVTVAVANVLIGQGGRPDNDTLLGRPYLQSWVVLTVVLAVVTAVVVWKRSRRDRTMS